MSEFPGPTIYTLVPDNPKPNSKACQHVTSNTKRKKERKKKKKGERMVDLGGNT